MDLVGLGPARGLSLALHNSLLKLGPWRRAAMGVLGTLLSVMCF